MAKQEGGNFVDVVEDLREQYASRLLDSRSHSGVKINPITRQKVNPKVLRTLIDEDGDGEVGESEDSKRKKYNEVSMEKRGRGLCCVQGVAGPPQSVETFLS
jgi:hypothetical protein